jgi:DNA repair protein REV1
MQRELGEKTGENLWLMAHGRDLRLVQPPKPRKSLGAEVNWGIRFRNQQDADVFLLKLSGEVRSVRLSEPCMSLVELHTLSSDSSTLIDFLCAQAHTT